MNGYGMNGWGFGMGLGWLIPLLLIVVLVYFFMNSNKKEGLSAKEILDKRYANGEIDEQEYIKKRDLLENKEGGGS
ncbi:SHOCT domain-containing protein [bacterium]|nr:SHOCT domain-containing protein [bacterium]